MAALEWVTDAHPFLQTADLYLRGWRDAPQAYEKALAIDPDKLSDAHAVNDAHQADSCYRSQSGE